MKQSQRSNAQDFEGGGPDVLLFKRFAGPFIIQLLELEATAVPSVSFFFLMQI